MPQDDLTFKLFVNGRAVRSMDDLEAVFGLADRTTRDYILRRAGEDIGIYLENKMREYPPAPNRPMKAIYSRTNKKGQSYLSKFKSTKHQRGFFGRLVAGLIRVPYRRTGKYGQAWTHEVTVTADEVTTTVGNAMPYAPLVGGGPDEQASYHKESGWRSLPQEINENIDEMERLFADSVKSSWRSLL